MSYFILKTRLNDASPRIFYLLKDSLIPEEEKDCVLHLKCMSIRRFTGISELINYLGQNTSNNLHETEPYILLKISWNEAVDKFGLDYDSDLEINTDSGNE